MSYTVTITRNNIAPNDEQAWAELDALYVKEEEQTVQSTDFLHLIDKLKATFPCICDLPDDQADNAVWSDGPLSGNAGKDVTVLGIVYPKVKVVLPYLIETANRNDFVVFDPQTGIISRPDRTGAQPINKTNKRTIVEDDKSFWKKLFGK